MEAEDSTLAIYHLHNNIWTEDLMRADLWVVFNKILTPRERQIVELKIDGTDNRTIAKLLKVKRNTLSAYISVIRKKYRIRTDEKPYNDLWLKKLTKQYIRRKK